MEARACSGRIAGAAELSAAVAAGLVRHRQLSAAETVAGALARARRWQPATNAVAVALDDRASAEACDLDASGPAALPLAGVPVSVKESFELEALPAVRVKGRMAEVEVYRAG